MRKIKLNVEDIRSLTDDEIRQTTSKIILNGCYATDICKNCGAVFTDPDGDYKVAKIVNQCPKCVWE